MNKRRKSPTYGQPLTIDRLREVVSMDPDTGAFTWIKSGRGRYARKGDVAGRVDRNGYVILCIDGQRHSAHRLVWLWTVGEWPRGEIDHINGVRNDNRPSNLRDVDRTINAQNIRRPRSDNSSGHLGVSWNRAAKKWVASIQVNGRQRQVSRSDSRDEAAGAYVAAKRHLHDGGTI